MDILLLRIITYYYINSNIWDKVVEYDKKILLNASISYILNRNNIILYN